MKKITKILAAASTIVLCVVLTVFSREATVFAKEALYVCAVSVLPSLFPFMVISQMIVRSRIFFKFKRLFLPMRLLGLSEKCGSAILLGALCGFPVGAKSAVEMYKSGEISKVQCEALISCANNTGPSFVVGIIGASFFKSTLFGWVIYFSQLISSFISSLIVNRLLFPFKREIYKGKSESLSFPDLFSAVKDSVFASLTVCGFIVFFFVMTGLLSPLLDLLPQSIKGIFCAFFELCKGAKTASEIGGDTGKFICGFGVGFSGLSVFCQTGAFCAKENISLKRCFCTKLLQGVLTGVLCLLAPVFIPCAESSVLLFDTARLPLTTTATAIVSAVLYIFAANTVIKE